MDYFSRARPLEPDGSEAHYTERLHRLSRLPVYFYPPAAPAGTLTRAALGIEAGVRLYVCAQSLFKLHPDYDAILGEILRRDPEGRSSSSRRPVGAAGAGTGAGAVHPRLSRRERARAHRAAAAHRRVPGSAVHGRRPPRFDSLRRRHDLIRGPRPRRPIVTWPGPFMRGRVTFGCYQQLGVTDCVAASPEEYVELAVRLANDPAWRAELARAPHGGAGARLFEDLGVVPRDRGLLRARAGGGDRGRIWPDQAGDPERRIATGTCIAGTGSRPAGWPCVRATRAVLRRIVDVEHVLFLHVADPASPPGRPCSSGPPCPWT